MGDLLSLRRALHRIPELAFVEHETSAMVREALSPLGPIETVAKTGLRLDLGPEDAAFTVLLRADMDALPIGEETGLPFSSVHDGCMHACGHDAHMAALVHAAHDLAPGLPDRTRVRLLFQPAEEVAGGARAAMDEGILDGVDAAFGLHVWNELPVGSVVATAGGVMANVVELTLVVHGRGGHGALPERATDPVVAMAQLVMALQTVVSRRVAPLRAAVLTLGAVHAGDAFNVIPDSAVIKGTVRTFSRQEDDAIERHVRQIAGGVGSATGTRIEVQWNRRTAATVNDPAIASVVAEAASRVPGVTEVLTDYRTVAGEDFGEILEEVPGCYALVGSGGPDAEPHHSPRFAIDEDVLPIAAALHAEVVRGLVASR